MITIREARMEAAAVIAPRDADVLLMHALACDAAFLLAHPEAAVTAEQLATLRVGVAQRAAGEPLQYVVGAQEFYGLRLRVSPAVLIPRPETELLVEQVLLWASALRSQRVLRIADVGTGSGAIAIALATHLAAARFLATDISPSALRIAEENAEAHGCGGRVRFLEADLLGAEVQSGSLDAVVSNPPYVPTGDAAEMQREVVAHEPHTALFAGEEGMAVYRRLVPEVRRALAKGGLLAMEFGFGQRDAMAALLADWDELRFVDDYAGIPRVVLAIKR